MDPVCSRTAAACPFRQERHGADGERPDEDCHHHAALPDVFSSWATPSVIRFDSFRRGDDAIANYFLTKYGSADSPAPIRTINAVFETK